MPERTSSEIVAAGLDLGARLAEEMAAAWERGERPTAEHFLERHHLADPDAIQLIYEETCLRRELGESAVTAEILARYPRWRERLALLLECDRLTRPSPAPRFPEVGEVLGDFLLEAEIGRGSIGRTFLASQRSLADRLVVLKATPLIHSEHLSLARLRHTNIVPIYFEQAVPERRIRLIGMPYLGGTTLARVLDDELLRGVPPHMRTGRLVLEALDRGTTRLPSGEVRDGPFRAFMAQAGYVQVICWIAACLADALQYAHDQGLVHFDVKPSNVQLAADGQPMLLDFHLSRAPIGPGRPAPDRLGGTPEYAAPEQRDAMESLRLGRPIAAAVDGRSDIYSLGLVLARALGGEEGRGSLRACNSAVSVGLSDLIGRCLERDPHARYSSAAELAGDLRRHLSDRPLLGVSNRSPIERWRKWRRRSPFRVARLAAALAVAMGIVAGWAVLYEWNRAIDAALSAASADRRRDRRDDDAATLRRGLELAAFLPGFDPRKRQLRAQARRVEMERLAGDLSQLVDLMRYSTGLGDESAATALASRRQEVWMLRDRFAAAQAADPADAGLAQRIKTDLLDLAVIQANHASRAPQAKEQRSGLQDAVRILSEARELFGLSPALARDLARFLAQSDATDPTLEVDPPRTAWEHYELGESYFQTGELAAAERAFRRSAQLDPDEFWPQFFWGVCASRLGRHQDAVTAVSAAIALKPDSAECYYNRARSHEALGALERAHFDYTRALELKPTFAAAALNRGAMAYRAGRVQEALADLERARIHARDARTLGLAAYNLALVHLKKGDLPQAHARLRQAVELGNPDAQALAGRLDPPLDPRPISP